jgi:uncharacterized damage-inducible protein DinB
MLDMFQMFAAYNRWANDLVYGQANALTEDEFNQQTGAFFGSLKGTLNHLLAADRIWMKRFTGQGEAPTRLDAILFEDQADLKAARATEDERIIRWVDGLTTEVISGNFTYTPITTPEPVTQRLAPAISHLFNHHTHHRGQAHMILTTLGKPSVPLDLIYFQRTERGKRWA